MRVVEALSREDQERILDLELDILDLKRQMLDIEGEARKELQLRIQDIKDDIARIKELGKDG